MRWMITDALWDVLGPAAEQAKRHRGGQKPKLPDRLFFEALLYIGRTGIPWRDLPGDFGAWDAVYNRFRRWVSSGSLLRLFERLTDQPAFDEVRRVLIDSTIVRAHVHAAGARKKKGGAAAQGMGRSRGGFSSKIVVTAADENTAIVVEVVPGQAADAPLLEPMLERTIERVPHFDEMVGDKSFDGDEQRLCCIDRDVFPNIPNRVNRTEPWPFLPEGYRERNGVERLLGKAKQFRRLATRYEKLKETFLGFIHLALGFIRLRALVNVNTA
jgi:transposase